MIVQGDTTSESFTLPSLAPGQTFLRIYSNVNNNGTPVVWNPVFAEIGGGSYRYTYVIAEDAIPGSYEWVGNAANGERVEINFDVDASEPVVIIPPRPVADQLSTMTSKMITRGDTIVWELPIVDSTGAPFDLTGSTVWFTVKQRFNLSDADAVVSSSWIDGGASDGITVDDPASGEITYGFTAEQSSDLIASLYVADVQVLDANDIVATVWKIRLAVGAGTTDRTSVP